MQKPHKRCAAAAVLLAALLAACAAPAGQPAPTPGTTAPAAGSGVADRMLPLTREFFTYAEDFCNGYAFAVRGQDCGYVDAAGHFAVYYQRDTGARTAAVALDDAALAAADHRQMTVGEEGLFPCYDAAAGLWGYADIHTGAMVIPARFDDALPFGGGLAAAHLPGAEQYQVLDPAGTLQFFIDAPVECAFTNNSLLAARGGELCLLDWTGFVTFSLPAGGWQTVPGVHTLARAEEAAVLRGDPEHIGVQTADGTFYLNIAIQEIARIPAGARRGSVWQKNAAAAFYERDGLWGLFDEEGALTPPLYREFYPLTGAATFVSEDGEAWYPIDAAGNRLSPSSYRDGGSMGEEGLLPACGAGGQWGYLTGTGALGIGFTFAAARPFGGGVAAVRLADAEGWQYIDPRGRALDCALTVTETAPAAQGFTRVHTGAGDTWLYAADETGTATDPAVLQQLARLE